VIIGRMNVSPALREALIWVYRLHRPRIVLDQETKNILHWAKELCGGLVILTNGRAFSQRQKPNRPYGLNPWPICQICSKPCDIKLA